MRESGPPANATQATDAILPGDNGQAMKSALITGVCGQDGSYLARHLLARGYRVLGTHRPGAAPDRWRLRELGIDGHARLSLKPFGFEGLERASELLAESGAREVYNLAAQSSSVDAASDPVGTARVNALGALQWLEAARRSGTAVRVCQAGSAEVFGPSSESPQDEDTALSPEGPYAVAKAFAHWSVIDYRRLHGVFAVSALLYNHESPLRGAGFVTRKIAQAIVAMRLGDCDWVPVGDLDAVRDWGFAGDFVDGMWRMLQDDAPDTFVLATGRTHTVRDLVQKCANAAGIDLVWSGRGNDEVGTERVSGRIRVRVDPSLLRPRAASPRVGNAARAHRRLGWRATTSFDELCRMMVEAEFARFGQGARARRSDV